MLRSYFVALNMFSLLAATPLLAQEMVPQSPAEEAVTKFMEQAQDPKSDLSQYAKKVNEVMKGNEFQSWIEKEIVKYRIHIRLDPLGNILEGLDKEDSPKNLGFYYERHVEPAFRNNEQVRRDVWILPLGLGKGVFSVTAQVRVTFTRYYSGSNAKSDALWADTKWPWQLPTNTNEVKSKMANNEGVRFEVGGDIAIGVNKDLAQYTSALTGSIGAYYKRGARFVIDILKINEQRARMRFIGLKNRGEVGGNLGLKNADLVSFARGKIREALTIGLGVNGSMSFSFFEPLTFDTMMLDYLFQFSNTKALPKEVMNDPQSEITESAMEEIFNNVKRGGFVSIFMFFYESNELTKDLLTKVAKAEKFSKEDMPKYKRSCKTENSQTRCDSSNLRVYTYFKGKTLSAVKSGEVSGNLSGLVNGSSRGGNIISHVTSYNPFEIDQQNNQKVEFFWLDNSFTNHKARFLFGRSQYNLNHDLDVLMSSNLNKDLGPILDVVVRTQVEDTAISKKTLSEYKNIITDSLPRKHQNNPIFSDIFQDKEQTNAYLSYRHSFGDIGFRKITDTWASNVDQTTTSDGKTVTVPKKVPLYVWKEVRKGVRVAEYRRAGELSQMLLKYFGQHPERKYMNLPCDKGDSSTMSESDYTGQKAQEILNIFNEESSYKERMEAFQKAKRDPIFERYLVGEFFSKLLPQDKPDPYFDFDIKFSSYESGTKKLDPKTPIGENKISQIYDSVSLIRNVINDQALDMQMTSSSENSTEIPLPANRTQQNM